MSQALKPGPDSPIVITNMSSNILQRKILEKGVSTIFFGAHKNLDLTGIAAVTIKKEELTPAFYDLDETTSSIYFASYLRA